MANFSATEGRIFHQYVTKGRFLNTKCVPERVWFFSSGCAMESAELNVKIYIKLTEFSALCANNGTNKPRLNKSYQSIPIRVQAFLGIPLDADHP